MSQSARPPDDIEASDRPVRAWICTGCGTEYAADVGECGQNLPCVCREPVRPDYGPNAQDVIDALRLVLTQDDADVELVRILVSEAPATDDTRGIDLLLRLIRDGKAKVTMR